MDLKQGFRLTINHLHKRLAETKKVLHTDLLCCSSTALHNELGFSNVFYRNERFISK